MDSKTVLIGLLCLTVISSGCLSILNGEEQEEIEDVEEAENITEQEDEGSDIPPETYDDRQDREYFSEAQEENSTVLVQNGKVTVEAGVHYFAPHTIEVPVGEEIEFTLRTEAGEHDLVFPELGVGTDVVGEEGTETFTVTFDEPGEYRYICSVDDHADQGMEGVVNAVEDPDGSTLVEEDDSDDLSDETVVW